MRTKKIITVIILSIFLFSCAGNEKNESIKEIDESFDPEIDFNDIQSNFVKWWNYHSYNITLSANFTGLDEQSNTIGKKIFLEKLNTGNYIPLKLKSDNISQLYKLFKLGDNADKSIRVTIKNESLTNLKHFNMEGRTFPKFDFTDLNGNHFTSENIKGKTTVIKTWFIGCTACVAEFPELNELVENHKNEQELVFISLALDSKPELEKFLLKKPFKYKVIPEKKDFLENELNFQIYPTHIIIDKNGTILKVVNKASEMIAFLENEKKTD